jgi:ABC-2 type transport system permease protein
MINDAYTIWLREMTRFRRNRAYIVSQLAFPVLLILMVAVPLGALVPSDLGGSRFGGGNISIADFLASGFLVISIAGSSFGGGINLTTERDKGFLREIIVAPVSRVAIILGKVFARITVATVQTLLIIGILFAFTDLGLFAPLLLLAAIALIAFVFVSIGLVLAGFLADVESFTIITGFIMLPIYFLSGAFFPVDGLPVIGAIARANPMYYGVDLFRYAVTGVQNNSVRVDLLGLAIAAMVTFAAATIVFDRKLKAYLASPSVT